MVLLNTTYWFSERGYQAFVQKVLTSHKVYTQKIKKNLFYLVQDSILVLRSLPHVTDIRSTPCYDFLFLSLYFSILIPFYSTWTILPSHSHVTYSQGSPHFSYLWLTSLKAYFLHCLTLPGTALWLLLTHFYLEAAPPLCLVIFLTHSYLFLD